MFVDRIDAPRTVNRNIPNQEGLYLARERGADYWNLIVEVYGASPFLRCRIVGNRSGIFNSTNYKLNDDIIPSRIYWGPKIEEPKVTMGTNE